MQKLRVKSLSLLITLMLLQYITYFKRCAKAALTFNFCKCNRNTLKTEKCPQIR